MYCKEETETIVINGTSDGIVYVYIGVVARKLITNVLHRKTEENKSWTDITI